MFNPFVKKTTTFQASTQGLKRWFKVRTADGNEYETTRKDYLKIQNYYPHKYSAVKTKLDAQVIMEYAINHSIFVDGNLLAVIPVSMHQYKEETIELSDTISFDWYVFEPEISNIYVKERSGIVITDITPKG